MDTCLRTVLVTQSPSKGYGEGYEPHNSNAYPDAKYELASPKLVF